MKILQLGLGPESTALYYLSSLGLEDIPRFDYAVFPDAGSERKDTYQHFEHLKKWAAENNGVPIVKFSDQLHFDIVQSLSVSTKAIIPAFVRNEEGGVKMLRRDCTGMYKQRLINQSVMPLSNGQMPEIEVWKAVPYNQIEKLTQPSEEWKTFVYPFCGYKTTTSTTERVKYQKRTTADIMLWLEQNGFPIPNTPACVFCPYQSDKQWKAIKSDADAWKEAIQVEMALWAFNIAHLHPSLKLLTQVEFTDNDQMKSECSGNCHL